MSYQVHVVNKQNLTEHHVFDLSQETQLKHEYVRIRTVLHSLTSNNITYARLGGFLKRRQYYPVPDQLPAPYNDPAQYGIVPVWGYGEIIESRVAGLDNGMLLWGFWPSSTLPVDMKLIPDDVDGHWMETSPHRNELMTLYNRYIISYPTLHLSDIHGRTLEKLALESLSTVQCGFLLNRFVFGDRPIHPLGVADGWDEPDADISHAVVINLSASGKSARGLTDALAYDREQSRCPLGLLAITTNATSNLVPKSPFSTKTISYSEIESEGTIDWLSKIKPEKIVICDFGGRGNAYDTLVSVLKKRMPSTRVVSIQIGAEPSIGVPSQSELKDTATLPTSKIRMNTSGLLETVKAQVGAEEYYNAYSDYRSAYIEAGRMDWIKLEWRQGVRGDRGFEGGWKRMCELKEALSSDSGLVYKLFD